MARGARHAWRCRLAGLALASIIIITLRPLRSPTRSLSATRSAQNLHASPRISRPSRSALGDVVRSRGWVWRVPGLERTPGWRVSVLEEKHSRSAGGRGAAVDAPVAQAPRRYQGEVRARREARFWRTRISTYERLLKSARGEESEAMRKQQEEEKKLKILRKDDPFDSRAETKACKLSLQARIEEAKRLKEEILSLDAKLAEAVEYFALKKGQIESLHDSSGMISDTTPGLKPETAITSSDDLEDYLDTEEDDHAGESPGIPRGMRSLSSEDLRTLVRETEAEVAATKQRVDDTDEALERASDDLESAETEYASLLKNLSELRDADPFDKSPENLKTVEYAEKALQRIAELKSEIERLGLRSRTLHQALKLSKRQLSKERYILEKVLDEIRMSAAEDEDTCAGSVRRKKNGTKMQGTGVFSKLKAPTAILTVLLSRAERYKLSEDYIGWLKNEANLAPITDKTSSFDEILRNLQNQEKRGGSILEGLRDDVYYVFVPGFLWHLYPAYFDSTLKAFRQQGLQAKLCSQVGGASGIYENAAAIRREILDAHHASGKPVVLVTHSKGGIDSAGALSLYEEELMPIVKGVVFCQCPFAGAPLATDLTGDPVHLTLAHWMRKYVRGSWQVVHDMMYPNRKDFLSKHPFPSDIATVSFHSTTKSAMSIQQILTHYVKQRYGFDNDGLVIPVDAEIPGSSVVRYDKELDHVGTVWPRNRRENKNGADMEEEIEGATTYVNPTIRKPTRYARSVGWMMVQVDKLLRRISRHQPTRSNDVPTAPEIFAALITLLQEDQRYFAKPVPTALPTSTQHVA